MYKLSSHITSAFSASDCCIIHLWHVRTRLQRLTHQDARTHSGAISLKDPFRADRSRCETDHTNKAIVAPITIIASMFATAVGNNLCNIGPTLGEAPRSIGRPYPGPANRATALLTPHKDGIRFLEECATPILQWISS